MVIRGLLLGFGGNVGKFLSEPCRHCYESAGWGGAVAGGGCSGMEGMYGVKESVWYGMAGRFLLCGGGGLIVDL